MGKRKEWVFVGQGKWRQKFLEDLSVVVAVPFMSVKERGDKSSSEDLVSLSKCCFLVKERGGGDRKRQLAQQEVCQR